MKINQVHRVPDRRVNRTQQLLFKALLELAQEKHYDKITVQNMVL